MRPVHILAILAIFAIAACAGDSDDSSGMRVDTIAGIPRVTNTGNGAWAPGDAWTVEEAGAVIGDVGGADEYVFGEIAGLGVAPDGRVYVADGQAKEVRVFAADGTFAFRFGRSGEGPGEFRAIDALTFTPDGAVVVRDPQGFRITVFEPDGAYRSSYRLLRPFMQFSGTTTMTVDDRGRLFDQLQFSIGSASADSLGVIVYSVVGSPADSIVLMVHERRSVTITRDGRAVMGIAVPFTPRPTMAVARDGTIAFGIGDSLHFTVVDERGDTLHTVARDVQPVIVTGVERDSALAEMRETAEENAGVKQLPDFDFPARKPAYTHIVADAEGHWWVGSGRTWGRAPEHARYDVFEKDGRYMGPVDVPSLRIMQIGDEFIAGVRTDSLGVPYAVVLPLRKPGAR
jgi:hypothetical protein